MDPLHDTGCKGNSLYFPPSALAMCQGFLRNLIWIILPYFFFWGGEGALLDPAKCLRVSLAIQNIKGEGLACLPP